MVIRYYKGLLWLRQGFCPYCYSSPPRKACPVCKGDNKYWGKNVSKEKREQWRERYVKAMEVFHS